MTNLNIITPEQSPVSVRDVAMLVTLEINSWTARKHDKKISNEVAHNAGTTKDAGRYNKQLINKSALGAIQSISGKARNYHYENTLPWTDQGFRILPSANYLEYVEGITKLKDEFDVAVQTFLTLYPDHVSQAKLHLGTLYSPNDYPSTHEIAQKFGIETRIMPIPAGDDFRVQMSSQSADDIRTDIDKRVQAATNEAMNELRQRVLLAVEHMHDRLSSYVPGTPGNREKGIFKDSMIENMRTLADLLPRLNVMADPKLDIIHKRILADLCPHDADDLRTNSNLKRDVADAAGNILITMNTFFGENQ